MTLERNEVEQEIERLKEELKLARNAELNEQRMRIHYVNETTKRDELIKELIDTFDLFDEVPLPFKIVNKMESVVKKAREALKDLEIEL